MKSDTHKKNEWQLQVIGIEFKVAWYVEWEVAIENFVGKTKKLLHRRCSTVCSHKQSQLLCVFIRPILPKVELLYEVLRQLSNNALTLSPNALLELQHSPDFPRRLTFFFFFIVLSQFSPKVKILLYFLLSQPASATIQLHQMIVSWWERDVEESCLHVVLWKEEFIFLGRSVA